MHQVRRISTTKHAIQTDKPHRGAMTKPQVMRPAADTLGTGRRFTPVTADPQIERSAGAHDLVGAEEGTTRPASQDAASAVELLFHARRRLELTCASAGATAGFVDRIGEIGRLVAAACRLSQEVALATALLQASGRYSIRHSVDVAVMCHVVGTGIGLEQGELASIVSAALTMNISMLDLQDTLHTQREAPKEGQRRMIRAHPARSEALLHTFGVGDEVWLKAVLWHHDALEGSGAGESAADPGRARFAAELLALADVYCARISARTDRRASSPSAVLKTFFQEEANNGLSELASSFIRAVGTFLPGTPVDSRTERWRW